MTRSMATRGRLRGIAVLIRPRFTHPKQRELMTSNDKLQRTFNYV
jgi:hypothetical protein